MGKEIAKFSILDGDAVSVSGTGDGMYTTITVKFDPANSTVQYGSQRGAPSGKFEIMINADGSAGLGERSVSFGTTVANAGQQIIQHAVKVYSH